MPVGSTIVVSNLDGSHRHPERFSRRSVGQIAQARKVLARIRQARSQPS